MKPLNISIIGVPLDYGQNRRGVDMGPSAIRYAGIVKRLEALGHDVIDEGNIDVPAAFHDLEQNEQLKNLEEVVRANEQLAQVVSRVKREGRFPLILGGDHSIALGSIAGLTSTVPNLGVIWFDAHADVNTEKTSPSGNIHGMSLAASIGRGNERLVNLYQEGQKVNPENVVFIGLRESDPEEKQLIRDLGIQSYTMHEIDRYGMAEVIERAIAYFKERNVEHVHLSLDIDVIDPLFAPGVGTYSPGGISYREAHLAMELLQQADCITSTEIVEVNPILDEKNKTADVAVALMGSLLGETLS